MAQRALAHEQQLASPTPRASCCIVCSSWENILLCSRCHEAAYCGREHQLADWNEHKKYCKYISGTKVLRDTPPGPNPLDPDLRRDPQWGGAGHRPNDPVFGYCHFKLEKNGDRRVRMVYPGKLTPFSIDPSITTLAQIRSRNFKTVDHIQDPVRFDGDKKVRLRSGRYRHLASFSILELRKLGWDGSMHVSTATPAVAGQYVPFVCGYDSDKDDGPVEPFDVEAAKRRGTVGLPPDAGLYIEVPRQGVMKIKESCRRRKKPQR